MRDSISWASQTPPNTGKSPCRAFTRSTNESRFRANPSPTPLIWSSPLAKYRRWSHGSSNANAAIFSTVSVSKDTNPGIARRGRECGIEVFPHRFRHHFSYTSFARGGARAGERPAGTRVRHRGIPASVPASLQLYQFRPRRRRGRPDGAERVDLPQMLRRYGASARNARARRSYDRIMDNTT